MMSSAKGIKLTPLSRSGLLLLAMVFGCAANEFASLADNHIPVAKPAILLTGFEPFGKDRPANPSWEGIRDLNGTDWTTFRIAARELPVVWGEPLRQLEEHIDSVHPVAIFAFGQGAPGSFAIESKAVNTRGEIPDNSGSMPSTRMIADDGPDEFHSTFSCQLVMEELARKGYPVRVSGRAGQYLCEEMLYSLEYTRSKQHPDLTVAFCHVPPLGSQIGEQVVDKAYVQKFVLDYLAAWQTVARTSPRAASTVTLASSTSDKASEPVNPELPAVKRLIEGYFKSWSEQRMKDYGNCFADDSVIQEINRDGDIYTQLKDPFVANQTTYHKMALFKAVEVPVKTDITFEADLARAVVYWKLTAGPRTQFGYDHFTLIKQRDEWKIANLVFYGKKEPE